jgi:hypothetical protein
MARKNTSRGLHVNAHGTYIASFYEGVRYRYRYRKMSDGPFSRRVIVNRGRKSKNGACVESD